MEVYIREILYGLKNYSIIVPYADIFNDHNKQYKNV